MKRVLLLIGCMMVVFSLTACSGYGTTQQLPVTSDNPPAKAPPKSAHAPAALIPLEDPSSEVIAILPISDHPSEQPPPASEPPVLAESVIQEATNDINLEEKRAAHMNVQIGNTTFTAVLEDNAAVAALIEQMQASPLVIPMRDYSGFEKVGDLGVTLPSSNSQTTTQSGDIVLYNGSQLVIFYGSNSWSYTRIGQIDNLSGWAEALGDGDITATFSIQ